MAVGNQASPGVIGTVLSQLATRLRDVCTDIRNQATYINGLGTNGLEAAGLTAADAATALQMINYMSNVSGCYYGTVQQGGTGGTGAIDFNFDNALSQLWGGQ